MLNILNSFKKVSVFLFVTLFIFSFSIFFAEAHQPKINQSNITIVTEPEISKAYYGVLEGEPHIYKIESLTDFNLYVNPLVPDIANQKKDIFVAIIKNDDTSKPLAVLDGINFQWEKFWEPFGRDWYWKGPEYKNKVEAGNYEIRVWSSNNDSKYSLAIGEIESFDMQTGIESINIIPKLKKDFFESNSAKFIFSPFGISYVLVLFVLSFLFGFLFHLLLRKFKNSKIILSANKVGVNKNIGKINRLFRALIGVVLFVVAITTTWSPILIFFAGFCLFEAIFSWCIFYQLIGRNSCPIE